MLSDGTTTYLYGNGRVGEYNGAEWTYYLPDALGSVRQLTDATGVVTYAQTFKPFGEVLISAGEVDSNYGFTGEWTDATGLQYLRARYYAPVTGSFISRDSWAGDSKRPMSYNKWLYGYANPLAYTDPSGYSPTCPPLLFWSSEECEDHYYGRVADFRGIRKVEKHKEIFKNNRGFIEAFDLDLITIAAAIAMQSQWVAGVDFAQAVTYGLGGNDPHWGVGPAGISEGQIYGYIKYAGHPSLGIVVGEYKGYLERINAEYFTCKEEAQSYLDNFHDEKKINLLKWEHAIQAMTLRIAASTQHCRRCRPFDRLVIAAMAQNAGVEIMGDGFFKDFHATENQNTIYTEKGVPIVWDKYFDSNPKVHGRSIPRDRAKDIGGDFDRRFMINLFARNMIELYTIDSNTWTLPQGIVLNDLNDMIDLATNAAENNPPY